MRQTKIRKGLTKGYSVTLRQHWGRNLHPLLLVFSFLYNGQVISITVDEKVLWGLCKQEMWEWVLETETSYWQRE